LYSTTFWLVAKVIQSENILSN